MLHGIVEENQIHDGVGVVVFSKTLLKSLGKSLLVGELIVELVIQTGYEVGKDKWLSSWSEELLDLSTILREGLVADIVSGALELVEMLEVDKSISIDSLTLVDPELNEVLRSLDGLLLGSKETLEDIGQMPNVELVMEVSSCLLEQSSSILMNLKSGLDDTLDFTLDGLSKLREVLVQVSGIDDCQRGVGWHTNSEEPEVSLETWVDDE